MPPAAHTSDTAAAQVTIYGIRHHGPGSARSLRQALEKLHPDVLLVEGPPEAADVLPLLTHTEMQPPVALLIYRPDSPHEAVFYPFAIFSPEWQALHYGLTHNITVRFMDLPQTHQMALREAACQQPPAPDEEALEAAAPDEAAAEPPPTPEPSATSEIRTDPLRWLAEAAGFSDGERWWEHMVEHRQDSAGLFEAILEAMTALRSELPPTDDPLEAQREASMRQSIRAAQREGFKRIAVVCGAWHAPALATMPPAKHDSAILKGLPKTKVATTWVPWSYERLCTSSGYGAGITSPGWYHHLWSMRSGEVGQAAAHAAAPPSSTEITIQWMTKVARLFRDTDLDASSAHIIEAVRLAESLAALRERPLPGLPELNEAIRAIFCFGSDMPMHLIHEQLIVNDRLGAVPDETPMVPLQQDLRRLQKRLRLKPEDVERSIKEQKSLGDGKKRSRGRSRCRGEHEAEFDFDLRKETDQERSLLLHRLNVLGIGWGTTTRGTGREQSTRHEYWCVQRWQPAFDVALIEAGIWGNTLYAAATARAADAASNATDLVMLIKLLAQMIDADLPDTLQTLLARIQAEAAVASDVLDLMGTLPDLANLQRYGTVRPIDLSAIPPLLDGIIARICIGLPGACASLNDDAAAQMFDLVVQSNSAIELLHNAEHLTMWYRVLSRLTTQTGIHGLLAGCCCRILFNARRFDAEETERQMRLALSKATAPAEAAAWLEGFLKGSGAILIHDMRLWQVLDSWVMSLAGDTFTEILPLLRRTFATFSTPERRQMGERVREGSRTTPAAGSPVLEQDGADVDRQRAEEVLPLLATLLGISPTPQE